jgi:hypothetical protein
MPNGIALDPEALFDCTLLTGMACAAPEEPWDASTHYEVADSAALAPSTGDKVGAGRDAPRRKTKRRKALVEYTQDNDQGEDAMSPALGGSYMDTGEQTLSPAIGGSCVLVRKACFPDQQTLENLRKLLGDADMLARTPDGVLSRGKLCQVCVCKSNQDLHPSKQMSS